MSNPDSKIGYLYVNGLNDGKLKLQDRVAIWWWRRRSINLEHAHINWFDGHDLDAKVSLIKDRVQKMLGQYDGVVLIGVSAGGSLALHAFRAVHDKNVCVVAAHARFGAGNYPKSKRVSLYRRAYMETRYPSKAFFDSVTRVETEVIPNLSTYEKRQILTMSSLADMIVPPRLMIMDSVENHRSLVCGHIPGFLAHVVIGRDIIINFAESKLRHG